MEWRTDGDTKNDDSDDNDDDDDDDDYDDYDDAAYSCGGYWHWWTEDELMQKIVTSDYCTQLSFGRCWCVDDGDD